MSDSENAALHELLLESVKEKRRQRRWGIFFKLIWISLIVFGICALYFGGEDGSKLAKQPHTALIEVNGPIMDGADADADRVVSSLRHAFEDKGTKGIIIRINSPGGSPVQSDYIYNEIKRLKGLHPTLKVYAVCADICASGAYYIASAADEIYANPSSLVGSIGVIMNGFGYVDTMKKLGVSRRLFTAGEHKGFLDPFSPLKASEEADVKQMLNIIHQQFIASVKAGRGNRLKENADTFSGMAWSGVQAKELGLIDAFGSAGFVARDVIKEDKIVNYTLRPNYFERIASRIGASAGEEFSKELGISQNWRVKA
jgi:protease-4